MIGEEYKAIINEEIDGVATPERSAKLTEYLDSHEEARVYHSDLMRLTHMLGAVEEVTPPEELKSNVMKSIRDRSHSSIPTETHTAEPQKEGLIASILQGFRRQGALSYAYSFAAGVLIAVGAFAVMNDGTTVGIDTRGATGAMAPFDRFVSVDRQPFDQGGIHGVIESKFASGQVLTEIDINSASPAELEILFDAQTLSLIGFEQGAGSSQAAFAPGKLNLSHIGENRYSLVFDGKNLAGGTLAIRIESGEVLIEKALSVIPESH